MNAKPKKPYVKPAVIHREKIEVLASVCDSTWNRKSPCRVLNQPACLKIRV